VGWFDVMAKAIPVARRGRLVGGAQMINGLLTIGAGGLIAALLGPAGPAFPQNYVVILALASTCLLLSLFSWSFVIEPDEPVEEQRPAWRQYLPQLFDTLRQDRGFFRLIVVRLLVGFDGLALGFYVLFATRELGLPLESVGLFTIAQTVGRILASLGLSALSERAGSHRVVQVATAVGLTAPLVGLVLLGAPRGALTTFVFSWVFLVIGVTGSARMLGFSNFALELAPAGKRPIYIGMLNTMSGVLVIVPTLGGWLLRSTSYGVLFGATLLCLVLAHLVSLSLSPPPAVLPGPQPEPAT
jgi:Na+/melibiose symporter-like transporter